MAGVKNFQYRSQELALQYSSSRFNPNSINLKPPYGIFGLPPTTWLSDNMILNSMPIVEFTPSVPDRADGQTVFQLKPDYNKFNEILQNHGFSLANPKRIRFAFLADNFPTDTFTNDYGDTFLQKMTDVASTGIQDIIQISGKRTGTEGAREILRQLGGAAGEGKFGDILRKGTEGGTELIEGLQKSLKKMQSNSSGTQRFLGGAADMVDKLIGGHRVDFPSVWRNSGYAPSYTMTIRLYNPKPDSFEMTKRFIIGPLAILLVLALPRSLDGRNYAWPFFHQIEVEGVWKLDPGMITSISVIKGGDQQQIAFNQSLGIVDVRLDIGSLYNSILIEEDTTKPWHQRPTLRQYLLSLYPNKTKKDEYSTRKKLRDKSRILSGDPQGQYITPGNVVAPSDVGPTRFDKARAIPKTRTSSPDVVNRSNDSSVESSLISQSDSNFVQTASS